MEKALLCIFNSYSVSVCVCGGGKGGEYAGLLFPVGFDTYQFVFNHRVAMHRVPQALLVIN